MKEAQTNPATEAAVVAGTDGAPQEPESGNESGKSCRIRTHAVRLASRRACFAHGRARLPSRP